MKVVNRVLAATMLAVAAFACRASTAAPVNMVMGMVTDGQPVQVAAAKVRECSAEVSWQGDLNGGFNWNRDLVPGSGFEIRGADFSLRLGGFNIDANFSDLPAKQPGTYQGAVTYFYVTDAIRMGESARYGFPIDSDPFDFKGVPVTLTIMQWDDSNFSGSIEAGPFSGRALGPEAPRTDGADSPLKTLIVSGKAVFSGSGDINPNPLFGIAVQCM